MSELRSVRMSAELHREIREVARIESIPVNTLIIDALIAEIDKRKASPSYGDALRRRIAEDQALLKGLLDTP